MAHKRYAHQSTPADLKAEARRQAAFQRLVKAWSKACGCPRPKRRPDAEPVLAARTHWIETKKETT